ncbi:MAG: Xaa-Pro peptidase family protein [Acidimicrobiia bacterium]
MDALAPVDVSARVGRLRAAFADNGVEALLVTRLPNVRYLTGFTGSAGMLLVGPDGEWLVTDGRYGAQAAQQLRAAGATARVEVGATQAEQLTTLGREVAGHERLGLEAHGVTWAEQRELADRFAPVELVATTGLVETLRRVKDDAEVERIARACAIADEAFAAAVRGGGLADGPTEREVALRLEIEMRGRGASGTSFETIVASGPNGALPHHRPTDRRVERGELVVIDFGCVVDGYCSDMTRTVCVGSPDAAAQQLFDVVLDAQRLGREAVGPGVDCVTVDAACRARIDAAGWGEAFSHGTGHGVGLEIHEAPRVASTSRDTLAPGYVVTVEPGVYLPGVGGVRIEDTVVVTADGHRALTASPKDLVL